MGRQSVSITTPPETRSSVLVAIILAYPRWEWKILHEKSDKWVLEINAILGDDHDQEVINIIKELQATARRIRAFDHTICFGRSLPSRVVDFDAIDVDVRNALKYARRSTYAIHPPADLNAAIGLFVSDSIVPVSLHRELNTELDALSAQKPVDFSPGTKGKVQMLIDPSLYPYIAGETPVHPDVSLPPMPLEWLYFTKYTKRRVMSDTPFFATTIDTGGRRLRQLNSPYSWIPSVFRVSDDGMDVHIESYINGLGPRDAFPVLYRLIEKLFLFALPHLERTMNCKHANAMHHSPSVARWAERSRLPPSCSQKRWQTVLARQKKQKDAQEAKHRAIQQKQQSEMSRERANITSFYELRNSYAASSCKGQRLKVIVKVLDYVLQPGQEYNGTWDIEGVPHERIVASVFYHCNSDNNISDEGIGLRRSRDWNTDLPNTENMVCRARSIEDRGGKGKAVDRNEDEDDDEIDYPSDWDGHISPHRWALSRQVFVPGHVNLGTVSTDVSASGTGRMLSFPNWIQHKVLSIKHRQSEVEPPGTAKKRLLCYFLVQDDDPEYWVEYPGLVYGGLENFSVLTTSDVPPQEGKCNFTTLHFLLSVACQRSTGRYFPPELCTLVVQSMAQKGQTREAAERCRRQRERLHNLGYFWDVSRQPLPVRSDIDSDEWLHQVYARVFHLRARGPGDLDL